MRMIRCWGWFDELVGTAILLFASVVLVRFLFGPGSVLTEAGAGRLLPLVLDGMGTGIVLALLIASPLGRLSGGHFNPAVSITLWLVGALPQREAAKYVAGQFAGALLGVAFARIVVGASVASSSVRYARVEPTGGWSGAAATAGEAASLLMLMVVVLAVVGRPRLAASLPAVVGTSVAVLIVAGGMTSGGSFNPARAFGPALLSGDVRGGWPYVAGPLIGAVCTALGAEMWCRRRLASPDRIAGPQER
jgi:glycerol uptake facilitator-like aquaporin